MSHEGHDPPSTIPLAHDPIHGDFVTLTQLTWDDMPELYRSFGLPDDHGVFRYLLEAPPKSEAELWDRFKPKDQLVCYAIRADPRRLARTADTADPTPHTVVMGLVAYSSPEPARRALEVGLLLGPSLQRTTAANEAIYLHLRHAFETLHLHRLVWRLNALNLQSRRAAERLGFLYEGTMRKSSLKNGAWLDSDWLAMLDEEWSGSKVAIEAWLQPSNFDEHGHQHASLSVPRMESRKNWS